jgi:hypothetical protein
MNQYELIDSRLVNRWLVKPVSTHCLPLCRYKVFNKALDRVKNDSQVRAASASGDTCQRGDASRSALLPVSVDFSR